MLPYFRKAEHNERGADDWHGTGGPLNVKDLTTPAPLRGVFVDAGKQAGYRTTPTSTAPTQEGVGSSTR